MSRHRYEKAKGARQFLENAIQHLRDFHRSVTQWRRDLELRQTDSAAIKRYVIVCTGGATSCRRLELFCFVWC